MPSLLIMIDGILGFFDENLDFHLRQKVLHSLVTLSLNFRLIAITVGLTKKCVKVLCRQLAERTNDKKPLVFDAVYLLKKTQKRYINLTHALLDCYDESIELTEYCKQQVIVICPDTRHETDK